MIISWNFTWSASNRSWTEAQVRYRGNLIVTNYQSIHSIQFYLYSSFLIGRHCHEAALPKSGCRVRFRTNVQMLRQWKKTFHDTEEEPCTFLFDVRGHQCDYKSLAFYLYIKCVSCEWIVNKTNTVLMTPAAVKIVSGWDHPLKQERDRALVLGSADH